MYVNSPGWKPTLKLGYWWLQDQRQLTQQAAWTQCRQALFNNVTIYRSRWIRLWSWHWHSSLWWWSWHQLAVLTDAPSALDTDESEGTLCQTDLVALSTFTRWRETVERKTEQPYPWKLSIERKNRRAKKWLFKLSENMKTQCSSLFYMTNRFDDTSCNFKFCQHSFTFWQETCPLPFQALVLTLMHIRVDIPLQHLAQSRYPLPL